MPKFVEYDEWIKKSIYPDNAYGRIMYQEAKNKHEKRTNSPNEEQKSKSKQGYKFRYEFMGIERRSFKVEEFIKNNANKTMLYFFLRAHEWTYASVDDSMDVFGRFFLKQRLIATSWTNNTLAEIFGVERRTIIKWLSQLEEEGLVIKFRQYDKKNNQFRPNVYILGYIDEDNYYIYLLGNGQSVKNKIYEKLGREIDE